jgi:hypothetical protein
LVPVDVTGATVRRTNQQVRRPTARATRDGSGARAIYLAANGERHGFADARAAVDALGRDRLAAAGAQLRAADGGVREIFFVFTRVFILL